MDRTMFKKTARRLTMPVLATTLALALNGCGTTFPITIVHLPPAAQSAQGATVYVPNGPGIPPYGRDAYGRPLTNRDDYQQSYDPYASRPDYQIVTDNRGRQVVCFAPTEPVESTTGSRETLCLNRRGGTTTPADLVENIRPLSDPNPPRDEYGHRRPAIIDGVKSCPAGAAVVEVNEKHGSGFIQRVTTDIFCRDPRSGQLSKPQAFVPYN